MTDRERREASDVPGYGRVGGIDDPVPRTQYGDAAAEVREHARKEAEREADAERDDREESNAVLYYLPFGGGHSRDLHHRIRHDDAVPTLAEFTAYYERVGDDHADDLSDVWEQWNRGSGGESQAFIDAECRSLSVGDIVIFDGDSYLCQPIGWQPLNLSERDEGDECQ